MLLEIEEMKFDRDGDSDCFGDMVMLYVGCSQGLWIVYPTSVIKLTEARSVFGITRDSIGDMWFVQRDGSHLHHLGIDENGTVRGLNYALDLRCIDSHARDGLHQIDFIGNELFVCDSYNNRLIVLNVTNENLMWHRTIYPVGRHTISRNQRANRELYHHFNSVYRYGDYTYLVAHNETSKSGKPSALYVLDNHTLRTVSIIDNVGDCAHNIIIDFNSNMYLCDSLNHRLVQFDGTNIIPLFVDETYKTFTRGLAMNDDITVVGGSIRSEKVGENDTTDGYIFILDKKKKEPICTYRLEGCGQIHEIRLSGLDYGLSNTWRPRHE